MSTIYNCPHRLWRPGLESLEVLEATETSSVSTLHCIASPQHWLLQRAALHTYFAHVWHPKAPSGLTLPMLFFCTDLS